ncbi:hypothetical protein [Streptomyces antarcticus]|uniref:hypothetical protein n=1 Tax=Streptomyces antarcticus TaxID=2996458 RepID=UPI002275488E|nr:hypothetical protein [Streptomyces sp. H34-S5]MCY0942883.1 hypothetical protein [Streptomyces sp. H34-AA3]MCZ4087329.1 hypothetical protein [Streptomyces sp. H34-S5]
MLEHLLAEDFVGAPALRGQLDRTGGGHLGAGSVSVDLRVAGLEQQPALPSTPLPIDAPVHDRSGEYIGELLLWVEGSTTLSALEYAWVTDEMPTSLPSIDQIQLRPTDSRCRSNLVETRQTSVRRVSVSFEELLQ